MANPAKRQFQNTIYRYYKTHGRTLPWRKTANPWHILVSEMMLQQTQVERVKEKYREFIKRFPTPHDCADSSLTDVLAVWQGLGYNRRARFIKETAQILCQQYRGEVPASPETLVTLPGIGINTAGAICAFAFNMPTVFIETNIRTVIIHFYFQEREDVHDNEIYNIVLETLDTKNPREWYWALMDYGVYLKKEQSGLLQRSAHYKKQSKFKGSRREIRGVVIRLLLKEEALSAAMIIKMIAKDKDIVISVLDELMKEKFISKQSGKYVIAG